jgi:UDP-GlcNAc:undecaprenyl-phosphate GlcNAc-1-phosphate transferase
VYGTILGNVSVLAPCAFLGAAMLGFLRYNRAPARTFLGDSGSLFVGFALAVLTLAGAKQASGDVSVLMAVCALPVPLIDTVASVGRRWLRRAPLFGADARHVHHQLAALGYGPRGVVTVLYAISSAIAAFGIVLGLAPKETAVAIAVLGAVGFGGLLTYGCSRLDYHEFNEAISMLLAAPRRARRVIRTQIVVRDLARDVRAAADPASVRAIVAGRAADLGVLQIGLRPARQVLSLPSLGHGRIWRVLYPLESRDEHGERQFLVVTCSRGPLSECGTAERVVRMLTPTLDAWFARRAAGLPLEHLRAELDGARTLPRGIGSAAERHDFGLEAALVAPHELDLVASGGARPLS